MPRYPELPPDRIIRGLQRLGFYVRRQRGGHVIMRRDHHFAQTVVPHHRTVKPIILSEILRQAGVPLEELMRLI